MTTAPVPPSRLLPADILKVGLTGLLSRRLRAALSTIGVAIGIAALVGVLGISQSSRADLLSQLDSLGTNLLTAAPGQSFLGDDATLPDGAALRIGRIGPVQRVTELASLDAAVRRSELVDEAETGGIAVSAASTDLLRTLDGRMARGAFLSNATSRTPAVVLGAVAAQRLAITRTGVQVYLGGGRYTVIGILEPLALAPEIDRSALIGFEWTTDHLMVGERPDTTRIYARTSPNQVDAVREVLAATADPVNPDQVEVSRPSDVLEARAAADATLTALFLGLGAIALLVGGIGIANVMVISVLERRSEIGLRRALGGTRRHIGVQFLTESLILAGVGGLLGIVFGVLATAVYAVSRGWSVSIPPVAVAGGLLAALLIGAIAGLYPAMRAAGLDPTEALRSA